MARFAAADYLVVIHQSNRIPRGGSMTGVAAVRRGRVVDRFGADCRAASDMTLLAGT